MGGWGVQIWVSKRASDRWARFIVVGMLLALLGSRQQSFRLAPFGASDVSRTARIETSVRSATECVTNNEHGLPLIFTVRSSRLLSK
jgi:hypothetical protein